MTDNTRLNPGQGGDLVATDEISGVKHQQILVEFGETGEALRVSKTQGLPTNIIAQPDNPLIDAFGRFRSSQASTVGDFLQVHDNHNGLIWTSGSTGSGSVAHDPNRASTILTVHTGSGDERIWQTKRHFQYQPGLSYLITMTGVMGASKNNLRRRQGYFNASNGIFLQQSGSSLALVKRDSVSGSVVDEVIDQGDWNIDTLDGTGSSSVALDISKVQIFCMDMQWLGGGRVRTGFFIGGNFLYAHEFTHANRISSVFMSSPILPIRFEITNEGVTDSPSTLEQICFSIMSEGQLDKDAGIKHSADRGISERSISTTKTPLISMRVQSGFEDVNVVGISSQIVAITSTTFLWQALLNPVISDDATWAPVSHSAVEIDITRSGSVSGGQVLASGYGASIGAGQAATTLTAPVLPLKSTLALGADLSGNRDEVVIVIQNSSGTDNFLGSLGWRELT